MDWVKDNVTYRVEEDGEEQIMELDTLLEFEKQPFSVHVKFECVKPITVEECSVKYNHGKDTRVTMYWYSYPPKSLRPRLKVRVPKDSSLTAEITATFLETPLDIQCQGDNKHFTHRAIITRDIELKPVDSDIIFRSEN
jgi:hypothetical protein